MAEAGFKIGCVSTKESSEGSFSTDALNETFKQINYGIEFDSARKNSFITECKNIAMLFEMAGDLKGLDDQESREATIEAANFIKKKLSQFKLNEVDNVNDILGCIKMVMEYRVKKFSDFSNPRIKQIGEILKDYQSNDLSKLKISSLLSTTKERKEGETIKPMPSISEINSSQITKKESSSRICTIM